MFIRLLTTLFFITTSLLGISDDIGLSFIHLTKNEGLSANGILTIHRDSDGFTWIGTVDGLNKYDGYDFQVFRNIKGDSTSLINNVVRSIIEDTDENILWIGTDKGLTIFRKDTQKFEYTHILDDGISSLSFDHSQNLWICTDKGKVFLKEKGSQSIEPYEPIMDHKINRILVDRKGNFWVTIAVENQVGIFNHQTGEIDILINYAEVEHFVESTEGHIWVCSKHGGLFKIDPTDFNTITRYNVKNGDFKSDYISGLIEISPGNF